MLNTNTFSPLADASVGKPAATIEIVPASHFTYAQLTDAYNQTRVDYLVPMPMNERKLREYVYNYDLDMENSVVALLDGEILGLAMLGVRPAETWVTRLGVIPNGRQKGIGRKLMDRLIENSRRLGVPRISLDVIKNNTPAEQLFLKCGFQPLRELLVIRRPPKPVDIITRGAYIEAIGYRESLQLLETRTDTPSWLTDTPSMKNAGNLSGLIADLPNGGKGWLIYQNTVFQLSRLVFEVEAGDPTEITTALLQNLHWRHPVQDTTCENVPPDSPWWPAMKAMSYLISFSRTEMRLSLI